MNAQTIHVNGEALNRCVERVHALESEIAHLVEQVLDIVTGRKELDASERMSVRRLVKGTEIAVSRALQDVVAERDAVTPITVPATQGVDPERIHLSDAVGHLHALCGESFVAVQATAKLALAVLEHPGAEKHIESIGDALDAIVVKMEQAESEADEVAERVGCAFTNARRAARRGAAAEGRAAAGH